MNTTKNKINVYKKEKQLKLRVKKWKNYFHKIKSNP